MCPIYIYIYILLKARENLKRSLRANLFTGNQEPLKKYWKERLISDFRKLSRGPTPSSKLCSMNRDCGEYILEIFLYAICEEKKDEK